MAEISQGIPVSVWRRRFIQRLAGMLEASGMDAMAAQCAAQQRLSSALQDRALSATPEQAAESAFAS